MSLGYLFKTAETATLGAISIGSVLLFLSDFVLPLESMPKMLEHVFRYNPFTLSSELLRKTLVFDLPIYKLGLNSLILLGLIVISFAVMIHIYAFVKNNEFNPKQKKVKQ